MKTLSLKLDEQIYQQTEEVISALKLARNRYINEALAHYNQVNQRRLLAAKLAKESKLVAANSMEVLAEFEALPYED